MGFVEKLMASEIEEDFTIICRPDEETMGNFSFFNLKLSSETTKLITLLTI